MFLLCAFLLELRLKLFRRSAFPLKIPFTYNRIIYHVPYIKTCGFALHGAHAPQGKIFYIYVLHTLAAGSAPPARMRLEPQKFFPCEAGEF